MELDAFFLRMLDFLLSRRTLCARAPVDAGHLVRTTVQGDDAVEDARVRGGVELEEQCAHGGSRERPKITKAEAAVPLRPSWVAGPSYFGLKGCLADLEAAK